MAQNIDIKKLSDSVRKLYALVNDHIGNINGHPKANIFFGGFVDENDARTLLFQGKRAVGIPAGITKTTDLSFGIYYGNLDNFTDKPIKMDSRSATIIVEGWGQLHMDDKNNVTSGGGDALNKKITLISGLQENTRFISGSGAYDSGWYNDGQWIKATVMSGSGIANCFRQQTNSTGNNRIDVQFNLTGSFNSLTDIIKLPSGHTALSTNIIAFSGWGQTSTGSIRPASFAIHNSNNIEYVPVTNDTLTSINGTFSFMQGFPTS